VDAVGLPMGFQVTGRPFDEKGILDFSKLINE
jgi:Asp-tRNA(Asn)/Glu-tRNA(Gln) amidotransferase A subunit family amidase